MAFTVRAWMATGRGPPAFAFMYPQLIAVEVDGLEPDVGAFGATDAAVDEHPKDGEVATIIEGGAGAGGEELVDGFGGGSSGTGISGYGRRRPSSPLATA